MHPPHISRRWLLAMLLLVWPAVARGAGVHRSVEVEFLRITIDSVWAERTAPGYIPVRFDVTNLADARVIEIASQSRQFFRPGRMGLTTGARQSVMTVRQTLSLARGDRVRLTLSVPVYGDSESIELRVLENGTLLESFGFSSFESAIVPSSTVALIVAEPSGVLAPLASAWARGHPVPAAPTVPGITTGPPGSSTYTVVMPPGVAPGAKFDVVLDPRRLPGSWLGYTTLRTVLLGPVEWAVLDDAQRRALLTWVACGGDLIFVDGSAEVLFGEGRAPAVEPGAMVAPYLFGRIHLTTAQAITDTGLDRVIQMLPVASTNFALPAHRSLAWTQPFERGFVLPIPGIGRVPAGAYLFILVVFGILIGPVNFLFLWRRRQQALLVVTAPLISMTFVVLLAGYVIAGEGFAVYGRALTFTMLDQARKQASTRATVSLYPAGTAPSGGLTFPRDMAVYPRGMDGRGAGHDRVALDLSDTQRFQSGLLNARMPTNVETIAFRPARERLQFIREGDRLAVVNGLGATITKLVYRAGDEVLAISEPLLPGERALLATSQITEPLGSLTGQALRIERIVEQQTAPFYLAVLERSPFWEPGVADVIERDSVHAVLGSLEAKP